MYVVYKHTSPTGKIYIGITSQHPSLRWLSGFGYQRNHAFFSDIVKYGWDNFDHAILHSNLAQSDAYHIEAQLIAQYHSDDPQYGYNIISTNHLLGAKAISQYTLRGEFITTYKSTSEAARVINASTSAISHAALYNGVSHGYLWKYVDDTSELHIPKNISHRLGGNKKNHIVTNKLPVAQYDKSGNKIAEYSSITEAHKATGINLTCIAGCCKGDNTTAKIKRRTAGGFIWKYSNVG